MLRTRVRAGAVAGFVLSVVFALLLSVVQWFDLFVDAWAPHMGAPTEVALRVPYGPRVVRGEHKAGSTIIYEHARVIVPPGTRLSDQNDEHRIALAYESIRRPPTVARIAALGALDFTLGMLLTAYLRRFGQNRVRLLRTQVGLFAAILMAMVVAKALLLFTPVPEYWMPMATVPLWVALSFDRRTAFLVTVIVAFVAASFLRFDVILLTVVLVRGMAASLLFFDKKHPRQMVFSGALAGLCACGVYLAIVFVLEGGADIAGDLARPTDSILLACFGGGLTAGIIALILRDAASRLLGAVSRDKLLDLTDLEQPLLKKMAAGAPGSWEHARAMANLAEAAASAIGADALLVRAGAYYHDLGKTVQPKYFVENLAPGEPTPHDELDPDVSADAIMAHVVMGTKILRDGGIPEPVVEFAYTHHGTQVVEFFWHKCLKQGNPKGLTEDHFRYPGMKPQTKETAILMLVDSIEAASRTIDPPERAKFDEMIQRILFTKLRAGQLDQSGLTIEDLHTLMTRMSDTLVNMYHHRIRYPWQDARRSMPAGPPSVRPVAEAPKDGAQGAELAKQPAPAGAPSGAQPVESSGVTSVQPSVVTPAASAKGKHPDDRRTPR